MLFGVLVNYRDLVKNAIFTWLKKCFTHIFYESEERKLSKESRRWWKIFYCYYEHGVIFYHLLNIKEDRGRFQNKIHSENEAINAIKLVLTRWQGFFFLVWVFYICEDYPMAISLSLHACHVRVWSCVIVGIFNKNENGLVRTRTMEGGKKVRREGARWQLLCLLMAFFFHIELFPHVIMRMVL
jgi:hypothetical protein